jgi:hypothetical protein
MEQEEENDETVKVLNDLAHKWDAQYEKFATESNSVPSTD